MTSKSYKKIVKKPVINLKNFQNQKYPAAKNAPTTSHMWSYA